MAGKSPVTATPEQMAGLESKACGPDRAEADRARAVLLTLRGWTSARIAEAFGVREDTVRLWRGQFLTDGVDFDAVPLRSRFGRLRCRLFHRGCVIGEMKVVTHFLIRQDRIALHDGAN